MPSDIAAMIGSSSGRCWRGGVGEVGQQGEAQVLVAVAEIVDLERGEQGLDLGDRAEDHGRHDDGAGVVRDVSPRHPSGAAGGLARRA
jgi:hypothetical protein